MQLTRTLPCYSPRSIPGKSGLLVLQTISPVPVDPTHGCSHTANTVSTQLTSTDASVGTLLWSIVQSFSRRSIALLAGPTSKPRLHTPLYKCKYNVRLTPNKMKILRLGSSRSPNKAESTCVDREQFVQSHMTRLKRFRDSCHTADV